MRRSSRSKGTILLLCSDSDVLAVLRDALEGAEYVVLPASDLGSAVDQLREVKPDLLIVRPHLENISGHEAAVYLRTKCNGLRVLMASGLPDDDRIIYRESLRSVEIFPKPLPPRSFSRKWQGCWLRSGTKQTPNCSTGKPRSRRQGHDDQSSTAPVD